MANTIKNKFTAPRLTEFSPKDLVIDVKNGHLYYKSNKSVFKVVGNLFSTIKNGKIIEVDEDLSIGGAEDTQVLFNNNSTGTPQTLNSSTSGPFSFGEVRGRIPNDPLAVTGNASSNGNSSN